MESSNSREGNRFRVAMLPGDGVGIEVIDAALEVMNVVQQKVGGFRIETEILPAGDVEPERFVQIPVIKANLDRDSCLVVAGFKIQQAVFKAGLWPVVETGN